MDLEAAQRDPRDQISYTKKSWSCPCNGCAKAVKQERQRLKEQIDKIDLTDLNGLGMKLLVLDMIKVEDEKKQRKPKNNPETSTETK